MGKHNFWGKKHLISKREKDDDNLFSGMILLIQETHEKYFYSTEHWNYFTNDEDLGPVILSLKQVYTELTSKDEASGTNVWNFYLLFPYTHKSK